MEHCYLFHILFCAHFNKLLIYNCFVNYTFITSALLGETSSHSDKDMSSVAIVTKDRDGGCLTPQTPEDR